jgi:hypothetical protein
MSHEHPDQNNGETRYPIPHMHLGRPKLSNFPSAQGHHTMDEQAADDGKNYTDDDLCEVLKRSRVSCLLVSI